MNRFSLAVALLAALPVWAQSQRPPYQTTKVEGTDNVYVFRAGGHQSMFVVTKDGVIATDPIGYGRPQMVKTYVEEIRKVTDKPIKYLVYSHHHNDHISGAKPFKDAGATIVAHRRARDRILAQNDPEMVPPDEVFSKQRTLRLGGTAVELTYVGLNHSDSTIVMRLPKEKILFAVDFLPVGQVPGRGMIDFYPLEVEGSIKQVLAMDWERLIPGHPGPGDRLGTKQDAQDQLDFLRYASETVKAAAREGKCWDQAEKEVKLPKYEKWPGYENGLPLVIRRYCGIWGRGT
ncbi:MAG TPA: MBL fold metallo-hydrolase [Burkholderiales bacterium]|nr:MBL fold metallo-hydrolase [Burkholderiales bacterium]